VKSAINPEATTTMRRGRRLPSIDHPFRRVEPDPADLESYRRVNGPDSLSLGERFDRNGNAIRKINEFYP